MRLKWGKSGARPALSRSCNRAVHGSEARMPASAWMLASRVRQEVAAISHRGGPLDRDESAGSSFPCLIDSHRHRARSPEEVVHSRSCSFPVRHRCPSVQSPAWSGKRLRAGHTCCRHVCGDTPRRGRDRVSAGHYRRCRSPGDDRAITNPHRVDCAKQHGNTLRARTRRSDRRRRLVFHLSA